MRISPCASTTSLLALHCNYGTWTVPRGLERLQAHKRLQRNGKQCSRKKRPRQVVWDGKDSFSLFVGTCEKVGSSILLLMVPRSGGVLQMNTPTTETKQQSHGWKPPVTDSSAPSGSQLYQHKKFSCGPGWIITVVTEITDPMGPQRKKFLCCSLFHFKQKHLGLLEWLTPTVREDLTDFLLEP